MENLGYKKNIWKEKNIFSPKMALENVGFTYKSQILKFMVQQKVLTKKMRNDTFHFSKFPLYQWQFTF